MSRIYFHTQHEGEAELLGSERAHMGVMVSHLAASFLPEFSDPEVFAAMTPEAQRTYATDTYPNGVKADPVTLEKHGPLLNKDYLRSSFSVGLERCLFQREGTPLETFSLQLNTALALGSDPLCLFARLHAQCEIHAWVEGPDRAWLADVIQQGLDAGLCRDGMGWDKVQELLRSGSEHPVVTSYSVTDGFPNQYVAGWVGPRDDEGETLNEDAWYDDNTDDERWDLAMAGLRQQKGMESMSPETLRNGFGHGVSMLDLFS
jgi:hypothetical protein